MKTLIALDEINNRFPVKSAIGYDEIPHGTIDTGFQGMKARVIDAGSGEVGAFQAYPELVK